MLGCFTWHFGIKISSNQGHSRPILGWVAGGGLKQRHQRWGRCPLERRWSWEPHPLGFRGGKLWAPKIGGNKAVQMDDFYHLFGSWESWENHPFVKGKSLRKRAMLAEVPRALARNMLGLAFASECSDVSELSPPGGLVALTLWVQLASVHGVKKQWYLQCFSLQRRESQRGVNSKSTSHSIVSTFQKDMVRPRPRVPLSVVGARQTNFWPRKKAYPCLYFVSSLSFLLLLFPFLFFHAFPFLRSLGSFEPLTFEA